MMAEKILSRHELKIEHRRLVDRLKKANEGLAFMKGVFQVLTDAYEASIGVFPVSRYDLLRSMIEEAISDSHVTFIRKTISDVCNTNSTGQAESGVTGIHALVEKATQIHENAAQEALSHGDEKRPLLGGKPLNRVQQAMRKVQKTMGLDEEPIETEDVMSDTELHRSMQKKNYKLRMVLNDLQNGLDLLLGLKDEYLASGQGSCSCWCSRYFLLKRMVVSVISMSGVSRGGL